MAYTGYIVCESGYQIFILLEIPEKIHEADWCIEIIDKDLQETFGQNESPVYVSINYIDLVCKATINTKILSNAFKILYYGLMFFRFEETLSGFLNRLSEFLNREE